jgi:hypothetical protein
LTKEVNVLLDELLKPYTHQNRPWMDCECLDGMNKRYEDVMAHLPEKDRGALKEWVISEIDLAYRHPDPSVVTKCRICRRPWTNALISRLRAEASALGMPKS